MKDSQRSTTQRQSHQEVRQRIEGKRAINPVEIQAGNSPIILGLPHTGTYVPTDIYDQLTPLGQTLSDTDWHVDKLYNDLVPDVTTVRATFHRYVIDANRNPTGDSLYPGQNTTGLVPLTDFDGQALWLSEPTTTLIESRRAVFHEKYHAALAEQILRVRKQHGVAILFDCHSIRSNIPYLFEGTLPDLNLGTNEGTSCATVIEQKIAEILQDSVNYSIVINGRFKGGWTTRHYGQPLHGIHAIQLELAQSTYLKQESAPFEYDPKKAEQLRVTLRTILDTLTTMAPTLSQGI